MQKKRISNFVFDIDEWWHDCLSKRSCPFALRMLVVIYTSGVVRNAFILPIQTGRSRIMRLRNNKRTSDDNQTNHNARAATNSNNMGDAESNNINYNVTYGNDSINADESAEEDTNPASNNNENNDDGFEEDEDNDVMQEEIDSIVNFRVGTLGKNFPAPDKYDYVKFMKICDLSGRAPWFDRHTVLIEGLIE